jgi:uncharacterized pyridoxamine 5'-phosphate oxidase family protein
MPTSSPFLRTEILEKFPPLRNLYSFTGTTVAELFKFQKGEAHLEMNPANWTILHRTIAR